jgi:hypothetical protein
VEDGAEGSVARLDRRGRADELQASKRVADGLDSGDLTASCRGNGWVVRFIRTQRR